MPDPKKVAILVEEGYQDLELWHPLLRLREEGIPAAVIGPEANKTYLSQLEFPVVPDHGIGEVKAADFGAVMVPGGSKRLLERPAMIGFIKDAAKNGAVLAAVSDGAKILEAAGAKASVSVKNTDALPEFCKQLLKALA